MNQEDIKKSALIRIVDDDMGVRDSYRFFLEGEGWLTLDYDSAESFLANDNMRLPGCILLDIRMPGMSGLQLQNHLLRQKSDLPIIFITAHGTIADAVSTVKKGACDFLTKPVQDEVLLQTIESAVGSYMEKLQQGQAAQNEMALVRQLTDREREIAMALSEGKLNKTIAFDFGISERTVQVHRANVMRKLKIHSIAELTTMLLHVGLKK